MCFCHCSYEYGDGSGCRKRGSAPCPLEEDYEDQQVLYDAALDAEWDRLESLVKYPEEVPA